MTATLVAGLVVGLLTAVLVRPTLGWLPEPPDAEDKPLYRDLAGSRFILVCGLLAAGATLIAGLALPRPVQPLWWVLSSVCVVLAGVDAKTTWLPLRLTRVAWLSMTAAAVVAVLWSGSAALLVRSVGGAAIAGGLYLGVWLVSRGGFGFGDVRFAPLVGAAAAAGSWPLLIWALVAGTFVGGLHGLARLVRGRRSGFPYAPSMLAGTYLAALTLAYL